MCCVPLPPCLQQQYGRILSQLRAMYTVGYSLSLGALILALGILIKFRYSCEGRKDTRKDEGREERKKKRKKESKNNKQKCIYRVLQATLVTKG